MSTKKCEVPECYNLAETALRFSINGDPRKMRFLCTQHVDAAVDDAAERISKSHNCQSADMTLSYVQQVLEDDSLAKNIGKYLAQLLMLKRKKNGRFDMVGGDKTDVGLARTLVRVLADYPIKRDLRAFILDAAGTKEKPLAPAIVIKSLIPKGFTEDEVKAEMWNLLGKNLLDFDNQWNLFKVPPSELVDA